MNNNFYDAQTGHRLELLGVRHDGKGLYQDLDARVPTRIVCDLAAVDIYPRKPRAQHAFTVPALKAPAEGCQYSGVMAVMLSRLGTEGFDHGIHTVF